MLSYEIAILSANVLVTIQNRIFQYELDAVCKFTYLGSTITDNLSLDAEIDKRIGKAASTLARLTARVRTSTKLSVKTKMTVYNACVISTLLYDSETWTMYAGQERRLNSFHLRSIRHILGSWEGLAADPKEWRSALKRHLETGEEQLMAAAADKRACRKEGSSSIRPETTHICGVCNKDCHSRIGLFSHKRRCSNPAIN